VLGPPSHTLRQDLHRREPSTTLFIQQPPQRSFLHTHSPSFALHHPPPSPIRSHCRNLTTYVHYLQYTCAICPAPLPSYLVCSYFTVSSLTSTLLSSGPFLTSLLFFSPALAWSKGILFFFTALISTAALAGLCHAPFHNTLPSNAFPTS
jgi:hypothetical protein